MLSTNAFRLINRQKFTIDQINIFECILLSIKQHFPKFYAGNYMYCRVLKDFLKKCKISSHENVTLFLTTLFSKSANTIYGPGLVFEQWMN